MQKSSKKIMISPIEGGGGRRIGYFVSRSIVDCDKIWILDGSFTDEKTTCADQAMQDVGW